MSLVLVEVVSFPEGSPNQVEIKGFLQFGDCLQSQVLFSFQERRDVLLRASHPLGQCFLRYSKSRHPIQDCEGNVAGITQPVLVFSPPLCFLCPVRRSLCPLGLDDIYSSYHISFVISRSIHPNHEHHCSEDSCELAPSS